MIFKAKGKTQFFFSSAGEISIKTGRVELRKKGEWNYGTKESGITLNTLKIGRVDLRKF